MCARVPENRRFLGKGLPLFQADLRASGSVERLHPLTFLYKVHKIFSKGTKCRAVKQCNRAALPKQKTGATPFP